MFYVSSILLLNLEKLRTKTYGMCCIHVCVRACTRARAPARTHTHMPTHTHAFWQISAVFFKSQN